MSDIALRPNARAELAALPSLLEFQSPSNALSHVPVQGPARGTIWVVCSMIAALTVASGLIPIDKVVTAQGRVVAKNPTVVVQPLETAIVRSINVREGQTVRKGEVLARLDPTFAAADLGALQQQVASLRAEVERLVAEASGEPYRPSVSDQNALVQAATYAQRQAERNFKLENYRQRIAGLEATMARSQGDAETYASRLAVATRVEGMRRELQAGGVGSQLNTLGSIDSRLEIQRNLDAARRQLASAKNDLDAMRAERDAYDQNWKADASKQITEQSRKLSDAGEQLNKATLRRQLVELRADEDAVVLTVARVSVGSVLQSGDQFITLVPTDAPLEIEANVPGSEAGFVHEGEPVMVKFDTFPYTQYGMAQGTVRLVSADSFTTDPQQSQRGGAAVQEMVTGKSNPAFYRARITIDSVDLHDTPTNFRLSPGMPVTADVKVGRRTVLSYMLGRVLPVWLDSMREP